MSIAELISQGTADTYKSTSAIGDSLAKLGQNVGAVLAQKEQMRQAQETLPALQQSMQASMQAAGQGNSGQAYSTMLNSITPQMMSNPQLLPFIKMGFDAIGKSSDDYLLAQKVAQSSSGIANMLPLIAATNPDLANKLIGGLQSQASQRAAQQPPSEAEYAPLPQENKPFIKSGEFDELIAPAGGKSAAQSGQQPSPTQTKVAQGYADIANQLNAAYTSGQPISGVISGSEKQIFAKDVLDSYKDRFVQISDLDKYLPGASGVAILKSPQELKQKGMNISSKGGVSLSFENIDPAHDYRKDNNEFISNINTHLQILDRDANLQRAMKALGGFKNISISTTSAGKDVIQYEEDGKRKSIPIQKETRKAIEFIAGLPQAGKNAFMPLYTTDVIEMPAPATKRDLSQILR